MGVTVYTKPAAQRPVAFQGMEFDVAAECTTEVGTTAEIDKRGFSHGSVYVPSGSGITTITWYGTRASLVTPRAAKDVDRVAITQVVAADEMCEVHPSLAGFPFIVPVTNDDGTLYFHWER